VSRRFVDVALFKRLLAVLRDLPPSDEVSALIAECEKSLGKGRVKKCSRSSEATSSGSLEIKTATSGEPALCEKTNADFT